MNGGNQPAHPELVEGRGTLTGRYTSWFRKIWGCYPEIPEATSSITWRLPNQLTPNGDMDGIHVVSKSLNRFLSGRETGGLTRLLLGLDTGGIL